MAITPIKPFRRVGVGAQYVCFFDPEQTGLTTAYESGVTKCKTVQSIETNEERSTEPVYASNEEYDVDTVSTPPKLSVENVAFPPSVLARMRGNNVSGAFVVHSIFDDGEYFAHGVVYPKKGGHKKYVWYPKCKLTSNSDSAQTKDGGGSNSQNTKTEIQTFSFNNSGDYKVEYDTELLTGAATVMTEEEFFAQPITEPVE